MTLDIGKDLAAHAESHQAGYQAGLADGRREKDVALGALRMLFVAATGYTVDEYQEMRRQIKAEVAPAVFGPTKQAADGTLYRVGTSIGVIMEPQPDDPPKDYGREPPIRVTNHDMTQDERLDNPQHGQAKELNMKKEHDYD